MPDRILDIADEPAALSVRYDQLVIARKDQADTTIPLADLAVIVVSNPCVSYTHAVLAGLAERGGVLIICDDKHTPCALMLPLSGHHLQAERFDRQAHASLPIRKRLWRQIVVAKVRAQGRLLARLHGADHGLLDLARQVRSGDPGNVEAQAARRYWTSLFGEAFRRDWSAEDQNRNLNYGYAVLRAVVARAICAAGLHPSIGLHHHNRYDAFCLASDLTEPFRPIVDEAVFRWVAEHGTDAPFDKSAKTHLLTALTGRYNLNGEWRTLFDVLARTAASLAGVFDGTRKELELPEV